MNDKECLMIDEQKSFIYMNQTDGCCADIDILENNFTKPATSNNAVSVMDKQQVR